MNTYVPVGERIRAQRRRRGMSQSTLGLRIGRTESYISKLERGDRPCDRLPLLAKLSEVLDVPVSELTGQMPPPARDPDQQHSAVAVVRRALTGHRFLACMKAAGTGHSGDRSVLDDLQQQSDGAWVLTHNQEFGALGMLLETLIPEAEEFARRCPAKLVNSAFLVVSDVYQAVAAFMAVVGETELAWVAADRAVYASDRAGDLLMAAASAFRVGHAFLSGARFDDTRRVTGEAAALLEPGLESDRPELLSLWGALTLVGAIAAARDGDGAAAEAAIRRAEQVAGRLGGDRNDFHTEFGPTNVQLHAVAVAVEIALPAEALRRAAKVDAQSLSIERRARFLIDVARAHSQKRDVPRMMKALREAEGLAPEGVRHHWLVMEMVRAVLRRQRRPSREVLALARRLKIT